MALRSRFVLYLVSFVVSGALAACGGSSSVTGPEAGSSAGPTAAIVGTVVTGASSSSSGFAASSGSDAIRVSVVGTSLTATTDAEGRFTLNGVTPGGTVELHFEGPGIDARLEIGGLVPGQTLTITVSVSGSTASMLGSGDEVEFRGYATSVGADRLVVDGRTVLIGDLTRVLDRENQPIPLSDIAVGSFLEVEGWLQPDGSILGRKVKLEDGDDDGEDDDHEDDDGEDDDHEDGDHEDEFEFQGTIQSTSPLIVAGTTVSTNDSTRILDDDNNQIQLSDLVVGMKVEVEGTRQADGSVLAEKIKIED